MSDHTLLWVIAIGTAVMAFSAMSIAIAIDHICSVLRRMNRSLTFATRVLASFRDLYGDHTEQAVETHKRERGAAQPEGSADR